MLNEIVKRARREESGDIDPFQNHRQRPLTEHLAGFRGFLESKGNTASHVALTVNRVTAAIDGCGFKNLADLNAGRVSGWLAEQRKPKQNPEAGLLTRIREVRIAGKSLKAIADELNANRHTMRTGEPWARAGVRRVLQSKDIDKRIPGLSIASSNHHLVALKSFGNWLVKDRRLSENPFAHLSRLNAQVDVRHERRASTLIDLGLLISAAERNQKTFRGLDGSTRAMLYRLAATTGLRAKELASLSQASFDLDADVPTVTVEAGYSKRRRRDVLPLQPDLVARLRQWLRERTQQQDDQGLILQLNRVADAKPEPLFPGTWLKKAAKMLRRDLETAGIAYVNDDGYCDFHSLRHSFISGLAACGVHPKLAQQLARHSTIALTLDRYTHVGLLDMNSALESLPTIVSPETQIMRATGTTDQTALDFSCTKSCTHPADSIGHKPSQPITTVTDTNDVQMTRLMTKPHFPAENEAFHDELNSSNEARPEGFDSPP